MHEHRQQEYSSGRLRSWIASLAVVAAVAGAAPATAQQFALVTDTGAAGGTAVLSRTGLVVTDRAGVAVHYDREPRYDSQDGRYRGFIDRDGGRALRFPADGNGALQVADLQAPRPQFAISPLRATTSLRTPGILPAASGPPPFPGAELGGTDWGAFQPPPSAPAGARMAAVHLTSRRIVPHPPLPDVEVLMTNSHHTDLHVVIADLRPGHRGQQRVIPAGGAVAVTLSRDAGGKVQETYEVRSPAGVLAREELITPIAPATRYDVSVYERSLQSIAIDRTGKSPDVIEDLNYQPKRVGIFPLPAGPALREGAVIDVWVEARAAGNPGGVRPLSADPTTASPPGPLQRALEEVTR